MAVTLKIRQALIVDGREVEGSTLTSQSISLSSGQQYTVEGKTIADDYGEDVLWATGDGGLDTFTHGFIKSDQDVFVELQTDNATPEYILLEVKANVLTPLPGKAGGDDTESIDGSDLVDGTDYDDVDQIRVQRNAADAQGDATVSLYLFA